MSLQLALTQLESLAELLNERKRESEQSQAFREMLRAVSGKLSAKHIGDNNRCLLRQDDVTQMVSGVVWSANRSEPLLSALRQGILSVICYISMLKILFVHLNYVLSLFSKVNHYVLIILGRDCFNSV